MFTEFEGKLLNLFSVASVAKTETLNDDGTVASYDETLIMSNGAKLVKHFDNESDRDSDYETIETSGGGSSAGMRYEIVDQLPVTGEDGTIYLVPKSTSGSNNYYDEYMYLNSDWEKIGDTEIDLSDYQKTIQYSSLPQASVDNVGKVYQYVGNDSGSYKNGYFYKCVNNGGTYSWENLDVQTESEEITHTVEVDDQHPFIFMGKKKGIYILNAVNDVYYAKFKESSSKTVDLGTIWNYRINGIMLGFVEILKDVTEEIQRDENFARYLGYTNDTSMNGPFQQIWISRRDGETGDMYFSTGDVAPYSNIQVVHNKVTSIDSNSTDTQYPSAKCLYDNLLGKQDALVSGTNIKTINNTSILGNGNIDIESGQIIQYSTLPTASIDNLGKIIQYTGTTTNDYKNGYFYKCVSDGEQEPTYSWESLIINGREPKIITGVDNSNTLIQITNISNNKAIMQEIYDRYTAGDRDFSDIFLLDTTVNNISLRCIYQTLSVYVNEYNIILTFAISVEESGGNGYYGGVYKKIQHRIVNAQHSNGIVHTIYLNRDNIYTERNTGSFSSNDVPNNFLGVNNTRTYTPTGDYNPATKKYVDDTSKITLYTESGISEYDSTATYNTGDYCYYQNAIYKCNDDNITGAWDSTKWDSKTYLQYLQDTLVGTALSGSY